MTRQCSNCENTVRPTQSTCYNCGADLDKQRMKEQQKGQREYDS